MLNTTTQFIRQLSKFPPGTIMEFDESGAMAFINPVTGETQAPNSKPSVVEFYRSDDGFHHWRIWSPQGDVLCASVHEFTALDEAEQSFFQAVCCVLPDSHDNRQE